ncbi:uncharacterized protein [Miscanthus floridulus]|uniref:uncharacterized protein n=1 Tax=Miscanthus floridulus TaxID=154761 RepID=UPI003457FF52
MDILDKDLSLHMYNAATGTSYVGNHYYCNFPATCSSRSLGPDKSNCQAALIGGGVEPCRRVAGIARWAIPTWTVAGIARWGVPPLTVAVSRLRSRFYVLNL